MEFDIYTQDGFEYKGKKVFKTLEELINFIKLNEKYSIKITTSEIFIKNIGQEDLF